MCRNIKTRYVFDPPATDDEVCAASLQFVRKCKRSGFNKPSRVNQEAFDHVVDAVSRVARELIEALTTSAHPAIVTSKRRKRGSEPPSGSGATRPPPAEPPTGRRPPEARARHRRAYVTLRR